MQSPSLAPMSSGLRRSGERGTSALRRGTGHRPGRACPRSRRWGTRPSLLPLPAYSFVATLNVFRCECDKRPRSPGARPILRRERSAGAELSSAAPRHPTVIGGRTARRTLSDAMASLSVAMRSRPAMARLVRGGGPVVPGRRPRRSSRTPEGPRRPESRKPRRGDAHSRGREPGRGRPKAPARRPDRGDPDPSTGRIRSPNGQA